MKQHPEKLRNEIVSNYFSKTYNHLRVYFFLFAISLAILALILFEISIIKEYAYVCLVSSGLFLLLAIIIFIKSQYVKITDFEYHQIVEEDYSKCLEKALMLFGINKKKHKEINPIIIKCPYSLDKKRKVSLRYIKGLNLYNYDKSLYSVMFFYDEKVYIFKAALNHRNGLIYDIETKAFKKNNISLQEIKIDFQRFGGKLRDIVNVIFKTKDGSKIDFCIRNKIIRKKKQKNKIIHLLNKPALLVSLTFITLFLMLFNFYIAFMLLECSLLISLLTMPLALIWPSLLLLFKVKRIELGLNKELSKNEQRIISRIAYELK